MNGFFYLAAIPVFGVIVLIHELGHFLTAKWADIRVEEFGVGFPPRAFGIRRGETIYSINWLPLGGFVRMTGENGETTMPQRAASANGSAVTPAPGAVDARAFASKPAHKRLIVLVAGVTMNLLLAIVLFSAAEAVGHPEFRAVVGTVQTGSPAAAAGMQAGDTIVSIDGHAVTYSQDVVTTVAAAVDHAANGAAAQPVTVVVRHPGQSDVATLTVNARVAPASGQGHLGITFSQAHPVIARVALWQAPGAGLRDVGETVGGIVTAIQQIIRGVLPFRDAFQGPVGIVQTTGQVAGAVPTVGWFPILYLTGALSVSLAVVNILPIPALDGGRIMLILIELARGGKRLSPNREAIINLAGMAALLMLMVVITFFDVGRIFGSN
jgi:regulator of sigma E protease